MAEEYRRSSPQSGENYLDWAQSFDSLLDDHDGFELFNEYMSKNGLEDILKFRTTVVGFKMRMGEMEDLEEYMEKEGNMIISKIWKKYFRHKKLECVPESVRAAIDHAVRQKNFSPDLYDLALDHVANFMRTRCHKNFLKSDIFIQYMQQQGEADQEPLTPPTVPPKPTTPKLQEVGRLEEVKDHSQDKPNADSNLPRELENLIPFKSLPKIPEDSFLPKVTSDVKESYINTNVDLSSDHAMPPDRGRGSLTRPSKVLRNPGNLAYIPEHDLRTLPRGGSSASYNTFGNTMRKSGKPGQTRCYDMGFIDKMPTSNQAAPYHAMSSTMNIVTRQNSALQSVVTGGDTSDTYSSFSEDPVRIEKRQYRAERRQVVSLAKTNKDKDNLRGPFSKIELDEKYITEMLAVNNPTEFAQMLSYKLKQVKLAQRKDDEFKEMLRQNHTDRISNPSHSVVGENPIDETDESILDDHVDQVFNKEEEANKLLLSKSQRRQADGRSVFSRVSTAAPIHQQVPKSHQQQRVSSTSSQFQDLNLTNGYSKNLPLNHSASTSSWSLNSLSRSNHNHLQNNNGYQHHINGNWPHKIATGSSQGYTTAKIQRLDGEKYAIAINIPKRPPITLTDLKAHMPSKSGNHYRYFFKVRDNTGQILYAEERENNAVLPLFDGIIIVKVDH